MEAVWVAVISGGSGILGAILLLIGQWLMAMRDQRNKQVEAESAIVVARIGADSGERIEMVKILAAQNESLRQHNMEQDRIVVDLTTANGRLESKAHILEMQVEERQRTVGMLERSLKEATGKVDFLVDELDSVRMVFQGELSDALALLADDDPDDDPDPDPD